MVAGRTPELAARSFLHDLVPNNFVEVATSGTAATLDLGAVDGDGPDGDPVTNVSLRGKRVWFQAITEDATILRGDHAADMTVASGILLTPEDNPLRSFWVDGGSPDNTLTHIAAGVGVLRLYYNDDL